MLAPRAEGVGTLAGLAPCGSDGAVEAVWYHARAELRRRWRSTLLLVLLVGMMGFVLWYVIDRRAKMRAAPPATAQPAEPGKKQP